MSGVRGLLPRRADYAGLRSSWATDLLAGVTVGVVALPLALAFGIGSGAGAAAGLVCAVVAGTVAALLGGSDLQVSGPTGALTVVLAPLVAERGPAVVLQLAVLAGVIVLAAAVLRAGRLLAYIPWPLVEGFTLGIAVVIGAQQVPRALGVPGGDGNAIEQAWTALGSFAQHPHGHAVGLLALTLLLAAGLPRLHRSIPASLIAVLVTSAIAAATGAHVDVVGSLPDLLSVHGPDLSAAGDLVGPAAVVALLIALESLLSAQVADGMADGRPHDPDRELAGQGLANIASGLLGGVPATGAIARTAVNARAGARTRVAAMTAAVVLAVIAVAAGPLVSRIPLTSLAGVLLVTAWRMVDVRQVRAVLRSTRGDAAVLLVTATVTIAFDLVRAVEAGLLLAAVVTLWNLRDTAQAVPEPLRPSELDSSTEHALLASRILTYRLDGPLFFAAAARFLAELTAISDVRVVILRLGSLAMLDATGAKALREIVAQLEGRGIHVLVKGTLPEHGRVLEAIGALEPVQAHDHLFQDLEAAVTHARHHAQEVSA